jgi:hypothetical protein
MTDVKEKQKIIGFVKTQKIISQCPSFQGPQLYKLYLFPCHISAHFSFHKTSFQLEHLSRTTVVWFQNFVRANSPLF